MRAASFVVVGILAGLAGASRAGAQEVEARSYSPSPTGTQVILAGFGGSKGGILVDPSLDIENVQADLKFVTTGFAYTFNLAGRQARILSVSPIAWGPITGEVDAHRARRDLKGPVNPRVRLTVGLIGAPALRVQEFAKARRRTFVGASLTVQSPFGTYTSGELVNLGYHRWAFKPELGASRPFGRFTLDGNAGVWLFTANTRYFPGRSRREQEPIGSLQGHVSYAVSRRIWVALDGAWFAGGTTRVDGVENPDRQDNSRLGVTFSLPIARQQSVKLVYHTAAHTHRGQDFDTFHVTWQWVRF